MNIRQYLNREYFLKNREKCIKAALIMAVLIIAFAVFIIRSSDDDTVTVKTEKKAASSAEKETAAVLVVDVSGAVKAPQVVELPANSRVEDAIEAAGGLKKNADITNVNRAAFVSDGEKITVPEKGTTEEASSSGTESSDSGGKVSINSATSEELQTLNGVGPVTASEIIAYREENGPFQKTEDLKNVSGIGDKTFEKLKDSITL